MAVSRKRDVFNQRGRASISGQSVAALSTFTWQIALNRSDYTHGEGLLYLPVSIAHVNNRRNGAILKFTTTASQAIALSTVVTTYSIATYPSGGVVTVVVPPLRGYSQSIDGLLSATNFGAGVSDTLMQIDDCQINGSNLEIQIENTHATLARTFTAELEWAVWKVG